MDFDEIVNMVCDIVRFELLVDSVAVVHGYVMEGSSSSDGAFHVDNMHRME